LRAEPAAISANESGAGGFALAGRNTSAEKRSHRRADITFKGGARRGKILAIEKLVIPLRCRKSILWIDAAVS